VSLPLAPPALVASAADTPGGEGGRSPFAPPISP
jgi:hypothetical protein